MNSDIPTPPSLLAALQQPGRVPDERWREFHRLYAPLLLAWAKQQGFQPEEAEDIAQDALVAVSQAVGRFKKEPGKSFRSWLYTIVRNKAEDARRRRKRSREVGFGDGDEPAADPSKVFSDDREHHTFLVHSACEVIRPEFGARMWDAFVLCKLQGRSAAQAAATLGLSAATVYTACSNALRRLREVIAGFTDQDDPVF